ncbi:MAG: T9SS type A sorting domain-containing protein [Bacteroidota bacterium]|nr:T9SS type A sorting domain-containing protein [Bacteroidota bacterium]
MKYLVLAIVILGYSNASIKKSVIEGRIVGVYNQQQTKIYFKKLHKIDSVQPNAIGYYKIELPSGAYDITVKHAHKKVHEIKNFQLLKPQHAININLSALSLSPAVNEYNYLAKKSVSGRYDRSESLAPVMDIDVMESSGISESKAIEPKRTAMTKDKLGDDVKPSSGQLTAGHWRDLDEWADWTKTNEDIGIKNLQKTWGIFPNQLYKLQLFDKNNELLSFAQVALINHDKKVIWQSVSNQDGIVYLWPQLFEIAAFTFNKHELKITVNEKTQTIKDFTNYINAKKPLKTNLEAKATPLLEIAFIVDATGSMGDEIRYLQSELTDVINRVQKRNRCLQIKTGSVFYKDHGDDYLTRVLPLSYNPATTVNFIGEQAAGGGGDFPEAIDVAIEQGINQLGWSNQHNPKIMFLVLDAPPHQDESSKKRMRDAITKAAELGIRIIPITASGIDKSTEFLMKYLAISTGGEYVYITDDSKIGNSHMKPTGGESKVSLLNNLMVKLVNQYSDGNWCNQELNPNDSIPYFEQQQTTEMIVGKTWHMTFMPNPVVDYVDIHFSKEAEKIKITDMKGNVLYAKDNHRKTDLKVNVQSWHSGVYVVYATYNNETISGKLLVMN